MPGLALLLSAVVGSSALHAHDIYSSWTDAIVRHDRLELTLTLARAAAVRLIDEAQPLPPITPENFSSYEPKLKAAGPELFEITAADKRVSLKSTAVTISGDADITFQLIFAAPAAGVLKFGVRYLFRLVDGHIGTLVVSDAAGKDLGWSPVSVDQPTFEVRVPAPPRVRR